MGEISKLAPINLYARLEMEREKNHPQYAE